jgi:hypothetical protein
VREATASGLSYEIGDSCGVPTPYEDMLISGVLALMHKKDKDRESEMIAKSDFDMYLRQALATLESVYAPNHFIGGEY